MKSTIKQLSFLNFWMTLTTFNSKYCGWLDKHHPIFVHLWQTQTLVGLADCLLAAFGPSIVPAGIGTAFLCSRMHMKLVGGVLWHQHQPRGSGLKIE